MRVAPVSRAAGVERDFEAFILPHLSYLYALAVRLLGQRDGAEDLVQEALLRAFRGFRRLRHRERGRLWLTRITTRAFYDLLRRRGGEPWTVPQEDGDFDLFDTIAEDDPFPYSDRLHLDFLELFDSERIIAVLAALPPGYRTALILAYVYGFKAREVAGSMGVPLGTVLSMLSRGRRRLERELWQFATTNGLLHREDRR